MEKIRRAAPVAATLALILAPEAAFAHAQLKRAEPAVGSTVQSPPTEVDVTFSSSVEPDFSTIVVQDAKGTRVDGNDTHLATGNDARLVVSVSGLSAGIYTVIWHATATDTHKTQGSFTFTVER
jgi:methionine-rich copper-binding protein CopC